MNLIIIGNGFDLYHGIPSKYSEFREYVFNSTFAAWIVD